MALVSANARRGRSSPVCGHSTCVPRVRPPVASSCLCLGGSPRSAGGLIRPISNDCLCPGFPKCVNPCVCPLRSKVSISQSPLGLPRMHNALLAVKDRGSGGSSSHSKPQGCGACCGTCDPHFSGEPLPLQLFSHLSHFRAKMVFPTTPQLCLSFPPHRDSLLVSSAVGPFGRFWSLC